jgi:hypothetical protein
MLHHCYLSLACETHEGVLSARWLEEEHDKRGLFFIVCFLPKSFLLLLLLLVGECGVIKKYWNGKKLRERLREINERGELWRLNFEVFFVEEIEEKILKIFLIFFNF